MRPAARRFLETRAPGMDPRCTRGTRRSGSAHGWTLMPTPMTTVQTRPETDPSRRIPPSFRSRQTMSFGHLSAMPLAPAPRGARAAATPTARLSPWARACAAPNRQSNDRQISRPVPSTQARPAAPPAGPLVFAQTRKRARQGEGPFLQPGIRGVDGAVHAQPSEPGPARQRGADPARVERLDRGRWRAHSSERSSWRRTRDLAVERSLEPVQVGIARKPVIAIREIRGDSHRTATKRLPQWPRTPRHGMSGSRMPCKRWTGDNPGSSVRRGPGAGGHPRS